MTKADTMTEEHNDARSVIIRRALIIVICVPALVYGAGYLAGYTVGTLEHSGLSASSILRLTGYASLWCLIAFIGWKLWPRTKPEPVAASTRRSKNLLWLALVVGVALGAFLTASGDPAKVLFSNSPIQPIVAIGGIAVWLFITPPLTWVWRRTVDEHEASAYTDGALIAAHAYIFITPVWWLAARAGWVPAQDPMIVFAIVGSAWSVIWLWRRFL